MSAPDVAPGTAPGVAPPAPKAGDGRPRILVLGYGNPGRQDDGIGPALAQAIGALGRPGVTTWDNDQLTLEDTIEVAAHDVVFFVDAAREGLEPFRLAPVEPEVSLAFTSHLLSPGTLLAIACAQFGAAPRAYLLAVRGHAFAFEEGLTADGARNLGHALAFLEARISALQMDPPQEERPEPDAAAPEARRANTLGWDTPMEDAP